MYLLIPLSFWFLVLASSSPPPHPFFPPAWIISSDVAVIKEMARSDDPSLASSVILGAAMWKDSSTLRGYLQRFPDRVSSDVECKYMAPLL